ncbi:MAG: tyrosine-type recombinase/integrase [Terrimicrobiaceae bacterium]|nr:tyrosine-type recombinase/integrase [Terrimicrobiaceae bacterium]
MASVHRRAGSKYFAAAFTLPDGTRCFRSTKQTDKTKALQIALGWEKAARMRATSDQAARVLADIVRAVTGDQFEAITLHKFCDQWLDRKTREVDESTLRKYRAWVRDLKTSIPAHTAMGNVTLNALVQARDRVAGRNSIASANQFGKFLRSLWTAAYNDGQIGENVAEKLASLSGKREREESIQRRPFTLEEVERILSVIPEEEEWYGMVLFGVYTGQRLGDVAGAMAEQIQEQIWSFRSRKTGLEMRIALTIPVLAWLEKHGPKSGSLFPRANATPSAGTLSNRFHKIMERANLVPKRRHRKKADGIGRSGRRTLSEISFHSFRHTTQSWLIAAGVSRELAMAHLGHEDEDVNKGYTHVADATLRKVAKRLPIIQKNKI